MRQLLTEPNKTDLERTFQFQERQPLDLKTAKDIPGLTVPCHTHIQERDVGIIGVIIYDDLALEAWTQRERDRERERRERRERVREIELIGKEEGGE